MYVSLFVCRFFFVWVWVYRLSISLLFITWVSVIPVNTFRSCIASRFCRFVWSPTFQTWRSKQHFHPRQWPLLPNRFRPRTLPSISQPANQSLCVGGCSRPVAGQVIPRVVCEKESCIKFCFQFLEWTLTSNTKPPDYRPQRDPHFCAAVLAFWQNSLIRHICEATHC